MKVSVCRNGMQLLRLALCRARPRSRSCLQWAIYSSSSSSSSPRDNGPINKDVVARQMTEQLYGYLLQHTREPEVLRRLRSETAADFPTGARMQVSPEQGAFLAWLVSTLRVSRAIEVGVFTGYSSLAVALALQPGGMLVACDRDERAMEVARRYWAEAGVTGRVQEELGPAADTLERLLAGGGHGTYDFVFIDADKRGYASYYELALQLLRPGGVIAIDNVLWYGKVADGTVGDAQTQALRDLNDALLADERVDYSMVPLGDGVALCTKR